MRRCTGWIAVVCFITCTGHRLAAETAPGTVMRALQEELKRAMEVYRSQGDPAPYFISYQVNEITSLDIAASRGALRSSDWDRFRLLDVEVRVGDYTFDNTHQIRGQRRAQPSPNYATPVLMPIEDDLDAMKSMIWLETDRKYRAAVERFIQVKANRAVKVEEEEVSADLSREPASSAALPLVDVPANKANAAEWEKKAREYSAMFNSYPEILQATAAFTSTALNQYLVNSEGASIEQGRLHVRLSIDARTRAEDGMELSRYESFDSHSIGGIPGDDVVRRAVEKMLRDVRALRAAPMIDPYTGPAILSGRASGVFFHEIFGHRIEGQRQKSENEGQTFARQINQAVLPEFLSVVDDPTASRAFGVDLNGHYRFDDEGVQATPVTVVENGILRNFLLSRSPVPGFDRSNGHGRKAPGYGVVGRQGNLMVQASKTVTEAKLREMLIDEARKQGKPYGLLFEDISGGFTVTERSSPQAFQVTPIMVYRIYVDGRPDELVRGVDLIGTPLTSFSKIVAAGDTPQVFNGFCGAESGFIPVSAVAPSILTTQIEVQKKAKSSERKPVLPPPALQPGTVSR
jgi:TldD protein